MSIIIRRMNLFDFFKLDTLQNDTPESYNNHFISGNRKDFKLSVGRIFARFNLFLSLISLKIAIRKYILFLALNDESVIGMALLRCIENNKAEFNIFIGKNYRSMGIGYELLKEVLEWAKLNKIGIGLWVWKSNISGVELYKKCGFKIKRTRYYMKGAK